MIASKQAHYQSVLRERYRRQFKTRQALLLDDDMQDGEEQCEVCKKLSFFLFSTPFWHTQLFSLFWVIFIPVLTHTIPHDQFCSSYYHLYLVIYMYENIISYVSLIPTLWEIICLLNCEEDNFDCFKKFSYQVILKEWKQFCETL